METTKIGRKEGEVESISEESLKNIIKSVIKKALDDNDQMVKLHRRICDEWSTRIRPSETAKEIPQKKGKSPTKVCARRKMPKTKMSQKIDLHDCKRFGEPIETVFDSSKSLKPEGNAHDKIQEEVSARLKRERALEFYNEQKRLQKGWKMHKHLELNSWFNQLDSVLHQKYMREHRHRVQSFYCQPNYYGTEIPGALYQQYLQNRFTH